MSREVPQGANPQFRKQLLPIADGIGAERGTTRHPRLRVFADIATGEVANHSGSRIKDHITNLSRIDAPRAVVQRSIKGITRELLGEIFKQHPQEAVVLMPVLRAGIAMWDEANTFFDSPETSFLSGAKEKGTDRATVVWNKRNDLEGKKIILLDPIIASGDTLVEAYASIADSFPETNPPQVTILSCYASPEGLAKVLEHIPNAEIIVGGLAETVDEKGYLVPPTHGDIGDKLFGKHVSTPEITPDNAASFMRLPFSENRPEFIPVVTLERHAERIQREMEPHIDRGLELFLEQVDFGQESLRTPEWRKAWRLAIKASKYNAVYFMSRKEAQVDLEFVRENDAMIDAMGEFIDTHGGLAPIANFALHSYVQGFAQEPGREVRTATKTIPRTAIQAYDADTLIVREGYFLNTDPLDSFENSSEIHDWHDTSHLLAAASSDGAFGAKYQDGLNTLYRYYRAITESTGMQDATGPLFSDGMLFTQMSRPLFEAYEDQRNPEELRKLIAEELFAYLGGDHALFHPGTGQKITAGRPINPMEIAVLLHQKRYERRAAEVETFMFVRGTPEGPRGNSEKDPLVDLTRSQRIERIATLGDESLYFEMRNVVRHRAHEDALGQFAGYLLEKKKIELEKATKPGTILTLQEDIQLLEAAVDFYELSDLKAGQEINLYQMVGDILETRQQRDAHA